MGAHRSGCPWASEEKSWAPFLLCPHAALGPFPPCPRAALGPVLLCPQGGVGAPSRALTTQFLPAPPRGLGAVVPHGSRLRNGGAWDPCSPAPLSYPVGREDPKAGREAHRGRPLRSRLQQAGQQGGAAGLGGQCHRDGGADRALSGAALTPRFVLCVVHIMCFVYSCGMPMAVNKGVFSRLLSYYVLSNTLTFQGSCLL